MKKIISFLLVLLMAFSIVSCGDEINDTTQDTQTTETEVKYYEYYPYSMSAFHTVVDMPSRILLIATGGINYYSKVDGESYVFCFNPICQHKFQDNCVSALFFNQGDTSNSVAYNSTTNRVYIGRGEKIYSMSFDASALRLECSLGEDGDLSMFLYQRYLIRNLQCAGNNLYFMYRDDQNGNDRIFKYDISSKKLSAVTPEGVWAMDFIVLDDYIFVKFLDTDNNIRFYTTDFDFSELKLSFELGEADDSITGVGVYNGEKLYSKSGDKIYEFDPIEKTKKVVICDESVTAWSQTMAATQNGCYFSVYNPKVIGKDPRDNTDIYTSRNEIWKLSYDGKTQKVLDTPYCEIMSMNIVNGGVIVKCFYTYVKEGDTLKQKGGAFLFFEIDENGNFVNPKPIGEFANDAELIEFLSKFN